MYNKMAVFLLNPLSHTMERTDEKHKDAIFVAAGLLLFLGYFLCGSGIVNIRYLYYYVVGVAALGLMLVCSLRGPVKPVRFYKSAFAIWLVFGLLQFISGLLNSVDYLPEALLILLAYPMLFVAWNNMGFEKVFKLLIQVCTISFYFFIVVCLMLFPINGAHYSGLFSNPNKAAEYLTLVFCCLLVEIFAGQSVRKSVWNTVLIGICAAFLFYSNSRTGQVSAIFAFLGFTVMFAVTRGLKDRQFWIRCAGILLASAVCCFGLFYVFSLRQYIPLPANDIEKKVFYHIEKDAGGLNSVFEVTKAKTAIGDRSADQVSSGRISIWKVYFKKLNLLGHETGGALYIPARKNFYTTSHNYLLQNAYNHGIFTGIVAAVLMVFLGIKSILYGLKNRIGIYSLMPITITVAFGITSMLASPTISFWYMLLTYYYFVQGPLLTCTETETGI